MAGMNENLKFVWHNPDWDVLNAKQNEFKAKMPGLIKKHDSVFLYENGSLVDRKEGMKIDKNAKNFYSMPGADFCLTESGEIRVFNRYTPPDNADLWGSLSSKIQWISNVEDIVLNEAKKQLYILHKDGRVRPVGCELEDDLKTDIAKIYLEGDVFQKKDGTFRSRAYPGLKEIDNILKFEYDTNICVFHLTDGRCISISGFSRNLGIAAQEFRKIKKFALDSSYSLLCLDENGKLYGKYAGAAKENDVQDFVLFPIRKTEPYSHDHIENGRLTLFQMGLGLNLILLQKDGTIRIDLTTRFSPDAGPVTVREPGAAGLKMIGGDLYAVIDEKAKPAASNGRAEDRERAAAQTGGGVNRHVFPGADLLKNITLKTTERVSVPEPPADGSEELKLVWHNPDWDILNAMRKEFREKMPGLVKKRGNIALYENGSLIDLTAGRTIGSGIKNFYTMPGADFFLTGSGQIQLYKKDTPAENAQYWDIAAAEMQNYTDVKDIFIDIKDKKVYLLHKDGRVSPVGCELGDDFKRDIAEMYLYGDVFRKTDGTFRSLSFPALKKIGNIRNFDYDTDICAFHLTDGRCISIFYLPWEPGVKITHISENIKKFMFDDHNEITCLDENGRLFREYNDYTIENNVEDFILFPKKYFDPPGDHEVENGEIPLYDTGLEWNFALLKKDGTILADMRAGYISPMSPVTFTEPGAAGLKLIGGDLYAVMGKKTKQAAANGRAEDPERAAAQTGSGGNRPADSGADLPENMTPKVQERAPAPVPPAAAGEEMKLVWHNPDWDILNAMRQEFRAKMPGLVKKRKNIALYEDGRLADLTTGETIGTGIKNFYTMLGLDFYLTGSGEIRIYGKILPGVNAKYWNGAAAEIQYYTDVKDVFLYNRDNQVYILHKDGRISPVGCDLDEDFKKDIADVYLHGDVFRKTDGTFRSRSFSGLKEIKNIREFVYDRHLCAFHLTDGRCISMSDYSGAPFRNTRILENIKKFVPDSDKTIACLDEDGYLFGEHAGIAKEKNVKDFILFPKKSLDLYRDDYAENGEVSLDDMGFEKHIAMLMKNGTIRIDFRAGYYKDVSPLTFTEPDAAGLKLIGGDLYAVIGKKEKPAAVKIPENAPAPVPGPASRRIDLHVYPKREIGGELIVTRGNKTPYCEITPDGRIRGIDNANILKCENVEKLLWVRGSSYIVKFANGTYTAVGTGKVKVNEQIHRLYGKELKSVANNRLFLMADGSAIAFLEDRKKRDFWEKAKNMKEVFCIDFYYAEEYDRFFALCEDGTVICDSPDQEVLFSDAEKVYCFKNQAKGVVCALCRDGTYKIRQVTPEKTGSVISLKATDTVYINPGRMAALHKGTIKTFMDYSHLEKTFEGEGYEVDKLIPKMNRKNPVDFIFDEKVNPPVYCVLNGDGKLLRYTEEKDEWETLDLSAAKIRYKGNGIIEVTGK